MSYDKPNLRRAQMSLSLARDNLVAAGRVELAKKVEALMEEVSYAEIRS